MRTILIVTVVTLLAVGSTAAQTDPVAQHYHAYRAALDRGDNAIAETEAQAAYDASDQRDGNGGHTGVLALNLANVRLIGPYAASALTPARRALGIASTHPDAGVDPVMARLAVARAELAFNAPEADADLSSALSAAANRTDLDTYVYLTNVDIARRRYEQGRYREARDASRTAIQRAPDPISRADAEVQFVAATAMDTHHPGEDMDFAQHAIDDAMTVYSPYAQTPAPAQGFTVAQTGYARLLAWREVLLTQLHPTLSVVSHVGNEDLPPPPAADNGGRPSCRLSLIANPAPSFPGHVDGQAVMGAATIYFEINERGEVVRRQVAAQVGAPFFDINEVLPQWRVMQANHSPANCTMAGARYRSIAFVVS